MSTAAIAGLNGSVDIGGAVAEARNVAITLDSDAPDATSYDSAGWKEFIEGLKGGNGSFETLVTPTLAVGVHAAATFAVSGGESYAGKIIIQNVSPSAPVDGVAAYSYTFLFSDRYIDNVAGGLGYIQPEHTPVLGLLGWPHATAATLMVLFAFNYSFLLHKGHKYEYSGSSLWISRFPVWFRYSIVFLTATAIFLILRVKMHMITFVFVILVLPFLTKS